MLRENFSRISRAPAHLPVMNRTHQHRLTKVAARKAIGRNSEKASQRWLDQIAERAHGEEMCRMFGLDPAEALRPWKR